MGVEQEPHSRNEGFPVYFPGGCGLCRPSALGWRTCPRRCWTRTCSWSRWSRHCPPCCPRCARCPCCPRCPCCTRCPCLPRPCPRCCPRRCRGVPRRGLPLPVPVRRRRRLLRLQLPG